MKCHVPRNTGQRYMILGREQNFEGRKIGWRVFFEGRGWVVLIIWIFWRLWVVWRDGNSGCSGGMDTLEGLDVLGWKRGLWGKTVVMSGLRFGGISCLQESQDFPVYPSCGRECLAV